MQYQSQVWTHSLIQIHGRACPNVWLVLYIIYIQMSFLFKQEQQSTCAHAAETGTHTERKTFVDYCYWFNKKKNAWRKFVSACPTYLWLKIILSNMKVNMGVPGPFVCAGWYWFSVKMWKPWFPNVRARVSLKQTNIYSWPHIACLHGIY